MGKFSVINKLPREEQDKLFLKFIDALTSLKSKKEMAEFLKDLLSEQEVIMFARRLQIAELLQEGLTYDDIREEMKVGHTTVAKVQTWLKLYGDGYRTVIKRIDKNKDNVGNTGLSWRLVKKNYPLYFWPELLLKEIVRSASGRQKKQLLGVVEELRGKTKIARDLQRILK